jgi:hypothetical protein
MWTLRTKSKKIWKDKSVFYHEILTKQTKKALPPSPISARLSSEGIYIYERSLIQISRVVDFKAEYNFGVDSSYRGGNLWEPIWSLKNTGL